MRTTPGKVAIFATCYVNYNEPGIGHDLLKLLAHNEIPAVLVEKEACCGMPKLELGDLDAVEKLKEINIPHLAKLAREGYAILTAVPSCTLMFKQELPLMFPDDADVQAVKEAMFDPFEYLMARNVDGLLKTDFNTPLGKVAYHVPCHLRVQNMGNKTREVLQAGRRRGDHGRALLRPRRHLGREERSIFDKSMKIGKPVFRQMAEPQPDYVSSDCAIAARHILQGMGEGATAREAAPDHAAAHCLRPGITPLSKENTMPQITRDSLMSLEGYAKVRPAYPRRDDRAQEEPHRSSWATTSR